MATAETMKMLTTTQPLISGASSDENDSELDNEEGYNSSDDSDDYGNEDDTSDKDDLIPSSNPPVCEHFLQGQCHFGSRCWNHHPADEGEVGEDVGESDSDDARDSHLQSSNGFDTIDECFDDEKSDIADTYSSVKREIVKAHNHEDAASNDDYEKYDTHSDNGDSTIRPPCHYYNTTYGGRYGNKCRFKHDMLSTESHTTSSSDESDSSYDTDDEPDTKSNEYGDSSYDSSNEYDFVCNDERNGKESDPYDEECYGDTDSVKTNSSDEYEFECNDERNGKESDYYDDECYGDTHSVEYGRDNKSYEKNEHREIDEDGYMHSDNNHSVDFNNNEDNAGITQICYFFNTPRGCKFGKSCWYSHVIDYSTRRETHQAETRDHVPNEFEERHERAYSAQSLEGGVGTLYNTKDQNIKASEPKYCNNHNTITTVLKQTTWQEHLAKDHEICPHTFAFQPNKVMRTTKEVMTAAGILNDTKTSNPKEIRGKKRFLHPKGSHQRCEPPKRSHQRCESKRQNYGQESHQES